MSTLLPWKSKPALSEERLNFLAEHFREVFYAVESLLDTSDDCNYGRGSLFFGRSRQRLIRLGTSGDQPWLKLANAGMDVTLEIEGIPFRFFRDDHEAPKKRGFWRRNESDRLFDPDDSEAVIFRFVVQRPAIEADELEVYFIGYNAVQEAVCEWRYGEVRVLQSTDARLPDAVHQEAARADLPSSDLDESVAETSANQ
jgi:hypothetical protein